MKNNTNIGGHAGSSRRVPGVPLSSSGRKDRDHDQDLILFQELHKREKERNIVNLLQPVSEEFEPNGNYQLHRIASVKKGSGFEFLAENDNKNDYDWLKTPPATPLFPSLEMDTHGPELVIQREIPILQPLSRFAGGNCNFDAVEKRIGRPKSPDPKPKIPVMIRCVTPSQKRSCSAAVSSNSNNVQRKNSSSKSRAVPIQEYLNQQKTMNVKSADSCPAETRSKTSAKNNNVVNIETAPNKSNNFVNQKEYHCHTSSTTTTTTTADHFVSSSMAGATGGVIGTESKPKPTNSDGFSNEKPPNLRTEQRSTSATSTRGRGIASTSTQQLQIIKAAADHDHHQPTKARRQSCSPSVSRGRKVLTATLQVQGKETTTRTAIDPNFHTSTLKAAGRTQTGNGTQVLGSRMVQRVMNARKAATYTNHEEKDHIKPNSRFLMNESSAGFGRKVLPKSSLDMALKHVVAPERKHDGIDSLKFSIATGSSKISKYQ